MPCFDLRSFFYRGYGQPSPRQQTRLQENRVARCFGDMYHTSVYDLFASCFCAHYLREVTTSVSALAFASLPARIPSYTRVCVVRVLTTAVLFFRRLTSTSWWRRRFSSSSSPTAPTHGSETSCTEAFLGVRFCAPVSRVNTRATDRQLAKLVRSRSFLPASESHASQQCVLLVRLVGNKTPLPRTRLHA